MIVTIMLSVPIPMDPLFVIVKTDIVDMVNGVKVSYTTVIVSYLSSFLSFHFFAVYYCSFHFVFQNQFKHNDIS